MRRLFIAGNWKMNGTRAEAADLAASLRRLLDGADGVDVAVCPPYTALDVVRQGLDGSKIVLGAQDMHWEPKGAFTGEVSPAMLQDLGCKLVILGHSERRHIIGESHDLIRKKLAAAVKHGLAPILCVGELLEERAQHVTKEVVERQITKAVEGLTPADAATLTIAYEPVWAIGTGKTASPQQAQEVHHFIRNLIGRLFGTSTAASMRVQYGGSVTPENIASLLKQPDVDGALVGGASLKPHDFAAIVKSAATEGGKA